MPAGDDARPDPALLSPSVSLGVIAREWSRIGITGFGGPPAHIALLRRLAVQQNSWLSEAEFEDGIAATSLLPGPASTQLAIFCAWRLAGPLGAIVGGTCFIVPGLIIILALSVLFLAHSPPDWVRGAAAGAGAAVPAVAVAAAIGLAPASWRRADEVTAARVRWVCYALAGAAAANVAGQFLVALLLACGLLEWLIGRRSRKSGQRPNPANRAAVLAGLAGKTVTLGVIGSLAWVAVKVGALSFGGGFVIIPLMQHDAVHTYHWMTTAQFLSAVALGQVTPGPVVLTVGVVGYAAAGLVGGLVAAMIAFAPSFIFVLAGGPHFDKFRRSSTAQAFLSGAGPAAIGAIAGAAVTLGLGLTQLWQVGLLAAATCWLILLRRGVVSTLLGAAAIGVIVALAGGLS
ncbi:MAG TPA: chromate efflux transporter [Streptosporangiaceae bacterium]|nr:chromate efflux transporter [Streptosporangiaceae bacterium]